MLYPHSLSIPFRATRRAIEHDPRHLVQAPLGAAGSPR